MLHMPLFTLHLLGPGTPLETMGSSYREHHTAATSHQLIIPMDMADSWSSTTPARPMSEPPAAKKIFSAMVVSAPVLLYVSLLHVPPYSSLLGDTKFWFLVSNAIILVLAADYSPMFDAAGAYAAPAAEACVEEYYVKHCSVCPVQDPPRSPPEEEEFNTAAHAHRHLQLVPVAGPAAGDKEEASSGKVVGRRPRRSTSELGARRRSHGGGRSTGKVALLLCKSKTEKMTSRTVVVPEEEAPEISEYVTMSDEELNRRVEEFIRKFNMEIRRQDAIGDRRD